MTLRSTFCIVCNYDVTRTYIWYCSSFCYDCGASCSWQGLCSLLFRLGRSGALLPEPLAAGRLGPAAEPPAGSGLGSGLRQTELAAGGPRRWLRLGSDSSLYHCGSRFRVSGENAALRLNDRPGLAPQAEAAFLRLTRTGSDSDFSDPEGSDCHTAVQVAPSLSHGQACHGGRFCAWPRAGPP